MRPAPTKTLIRATTLILAMAATACSEDPTDPVELSRNQFRVIVTGDAVGSVEGVATRLTASQEGQLMAQVNLEEPIPGLDGSRLHFFFADPTIGDGTYSAASGWVLDPGLGESEVGVVLGDVDGQTIAVTHSASSGTLSVDPGSEVIAGFTVTLEPVRPDVTTTYQVSGEFRVPA